MCKTLITIIKSFDFFPLHQFMNLNSVPLVTESRIPEISLRELKPRRGYEQIAEWTSGKLTFEISFTWKF